MSVGRAHTRTLHLEAILVHTSKLRVVLPLAASSSATLRLRLAELATLARATAVHEDVRVGVQLILKSNADLKSPSQE